eukprot:7181959-Alexandrium_andersonii.AAC.1
MRLGLPGLSSRGKRSSPRFGSPLPQWKRRGSCRFAGPRGRHKAILAQKACLKEPKAEYISASVRPELVQAPVQTLTQTTTQTTQAPGAQ